MVEQVEKEEKKMERKVRGGEEDVERVRKEQQTRIISSEGA